MAQGVTRVVHRCEDAVESECLGEKSDSKRLCICIYFENLIKNYWTSERIRTSVVIVDLFHISRLQFSICFFFFLSINGCVWAETLFVINFYKENGRVKM